MLELILMVFFCGKLREILSAKHRSAIGYQIALVGLWLLVEPVLLGLICVVLFFALGNEAEQLILFAYVFALFGALATSLIVCLAAVAALPNDSKPAYRWEPTAAPGS